MHYVDERAREAIEEDATDAFEAVRDRALIAVLAYWAPAGPRYWPISRDGRRNGLRWHSVDLENGVITVLGKNRKRDPIPLPDQAVAPLRRLEKLFDPPTDEWSVFPSRHPPSLSVHVEASELGEDDTAVFDDE